MSLFRNPEPPDWGTGYAMPTAEEREGIGPIGALCIAIPLSLLLWAVVMVVLFNLIR